MKHLLLALFIGLTAIGCRDRETEPQDQLPPITQHGANTAGCLVNGKVLIPKNPRTFTVPYIYGLKIQKKENKYHLLIGDYQRNNDEIISLIILENDNNPKIYYSIEDNTSTEGSYRVYVSKDNLAEIKLLKYKLPIISGTFSGTLYNEKNSNDKIEIKDGRFDININTLNK